MSSAASPQVLVGRTRFSHGSVLHRRIIPSDTPRRKRSRRREYSRRTPRRLIIVTCLSRTILVRFNSSSTANRFDGKRRRWPVHLSDSRRHAVFSEPELRQLQTHSAACVRLLPVFELIVSIESCRAQFHARKPRAERLHRSRTDSYAADQ